MESKTDIYTYFTKPTGVTELLYSAEDWVRINLQLETAGPVAVGTRDSVTPVLSGKGVLLPNIGDTSFEFILARGNRLWIASESINRVKVVIEPIPFLEKILRSVDGLSGIFGALVRRKNKTEAAIQSATQGFRKGIL